MKTPEAEMITFVLGINKRVLMCTIIWHTFYDSKINPLADELGNRQYFFPAGWCLPLIFSHFGDQIKCHFFDTFTFHSHISGV